MRWNCCLTLVLAAWNATACAADSTVLVDPQLPANFVAGAISEIGMNGYWAAGTANEIPVLVRYAPQGSVQFVRYVIDNNDIAGYSLAATADGGVVLATYETNLGLPQCPLRRYDADGQFIWQSQLDAEGADGACPRMRADGGGGLWLQSSNEYYLPPSLLDDDGVLHPPIALDNGGIGDIAPDPALNQAYAAGSLSDATGTTYRAAIWRLGHDNPQLIAQAPDSDLGSLLTTAVIGSDGDLYAFGTIGQAPNRSLYGMAFDRSHGTLLWARDLSVPVSAAPTQATAANGSIALLINDGYAMSVLQVDNAGSVRWASAGESLLYPSDTTPTIAVADNGDVALAQKDTAAAKILLSRYDDGGQVLFKDSSQPALPGLTWNLRMLADATTLLAGPGFQRNARDGATLSPPANAGAIAQANLDYIDTIAADGSSYYVTSNPDARQYAVIALAPDGSERWRQTFTSTWTQGGLGYILSLTLRQNDVCLVAVVDGPLLTRCLALTDGAATATLTLAGSAQPPGPIGTGATPEGNLVVVYSDASLAMHHVLIGPHGELLHDVMPLQGTEQPYAPTFDANGNLGDMVAVGKFLKINADGTRAYLASVDPLAIRGMLTPDGGALIVTWKIINQPLTLSRIDASSQPLWKITLPSDNAYANLRSVHFSQDSVFFALGRSASPFYPSSSLIMRVAMADGAIVWSVPSQTFDVDYVPELVFDANAKHLVVVAEGPINRLHMIKIDPATGAVLGDGYDACGRDTCLFSRAAIGTDNVLRTAVDSTDGLTGSAFQLGFYRNPYATKFTRIDQPGIRGVWYAPYSSGRGFVLDYLADSHTIFMPWFTFGASGAHDTSDVAWYTLQGQADVAATSATLTLYSTTPGTFASGITTTIPVGSATLRFNDCAHGTLQYTFTAGADSGRSGTVSLSRLSPAITSCTLADGSTQPIAAPAPARGFDVAQSGSWYDPSTSGQGVELSVLPPSGASDGLIFGAWFTYDPAGLANDDAHHHWFSLQGDLSSASNGKVDLPIYQTLGTQLEGAPTRNIHAVGHATLMIVGCGHAILSYQFDSPLAHAFASAKGTLHLTQFGADCTN